MILEIPHSALDRGNMLLKVKDVLGNDQSWFSLVTGLSMPVKLVHVDVDAVFLLLL
jgi:hypothetical protein